tara:strand:+ start:287 stop:613 length:327 start_codon:yes stop_codon:yes gene_type:complete
MFLTVNVEAEENLAMNVQNRHHQQEAAKRSKASQETKFFQVGHVTYEINNSEEHGLTFSLIAGEALSAKDRKPLFSGFVETGMVEELRTLALYLKELQLRDKFGGILD